MFIILLNLFFRAWVYFKTLIVYTSMYAFIFKISRMKLCKQDLRHRCQVSKFLIWAVYHWTCIALWCQTLAAYVLEIVQRLAGWWQLLRHPWSHFKDGRCLFWSHAVLIVQSDPAKCDEFNRFLRRSQRLWCDEPKISTVRGTTAESGLRDRQSAEP